MPLPNTKWEELSPPLSNPILSVIKSLGFKTLTPVQGATIPLLMSRKDVSAEAVTGSGKTLAFLVPMLEILQARHKEQAWKPSEIGAIVISPTRELASQISDVLAKFTEHADLKVFKHKLLVGGNSIEEDLKSLETNSPVILISTPGRLCDILERRGVLNLAARVKSLDILVLDEADRLLDLGFKLTINTILSYLPRQRRTGLFSATQTKELTDLVRAGLRNPVLVSVKEKATINTPIRLQNYYALIEPDKKFATILSFLKNTDIKKGMIFMPTCACVDYWSHILSHFLKTKKVLGLHGKMKQKRSKIVSTFRSEDNVLLMCTDVLARGLDIPEVNWVIQWDPPSSAAAFIHRVGRTARQGEAGSSIVFLLPNEDAYVNFLKLNQKVELDPFEVEDKDCMELDDINAQIHKLQLNDRSIYDKAMRAFVSHVQAYSKHECSAILRLKDVNLGKMANSYALLSMPKMPELKKLNASDFKGPNVKFEFNNIKYKNKQKEDSRRNKLAVYKETGNWPGFKKGKQKSEAWELSKKCRNDAKDKRSSRREKRKLLKESGVVLKKKRKNALSEEDLKELANDIRIFKQFKKKKITEEEFDEQMGIDD